MKIIEKNKIFLRYFFISVLVTLLDIIVSYILENYIILNHFELNIRILIANTTGIIVGFITQYLLSSKHVYDKSDIKTFVKFFSTFLLGLFLQNSVIIFSRSIIFGGSTTGVAFILSKILSITIPFFFIYYLRKKWIGEINC